MQEPMYDEVPQVIEQAQVEPVDSNPQQLDEELVSLALLVGFSIIQAAREGDIKSLYWFVEELNRAQKRNRNLQRLLDLEAEEIEKLLSSLEQQAQAPQEQAPAEQPAPPPTEAASPTAPNEREAIRKVVMESPRGANARGGSRGDRLRDHFPGGQ